MLKVGIQGMGHIGKKHLSAIELIDGVEVTGTSDIQSGHKSYQELLDNSEINLISVCTPNSLHAEHGISALNAGKHVICEKPFALSKSDCEKLIDASLQSGKYIFCVMQNRFSPVSQWLKKIITDQNLGEILMVNVACYWNRDSRYYKGDTWKGSKDIDGGTLFTQFAHYIDSLYFLFGNIDITNAHFENFTHKDLIDFEDSGNFSFRLKNGAIGSFQYSTSVWDKNFESTMSIIGTKGTIKVGGQYMDTVSYCHGSEISSPVLPKNDNISNLSKIYSNAVDVIAGNQRVMTNAMDGMKVVEIIENIYNFK